MQPVFWITGPPAAGKSTLCEALLARYDRGMCIPVDDLRLWVRSGLSESVPWTDETERQFQIAEAATCAVARTYHEHGFAVVIDHCRNMPRLEQVSNEHLGDLPVLKICLLPDLEANLARNRDRTNKPFDHTWLIDTIKFTNDRFRNDHLPGWLVIDNSNLTTEQTIDVILSKTVG